MKKFLIAILCILLLAAAGFGVFYMMQDTPKIELLQMTLQGEREVYVDFRGTYADAGALAQYITEEQTRQIPVRITGDPVNTDKIGTYLQKYIARHEGRVATDYRAVHVVDTEAPELQLNGGQVYTMSAGHAYVEFGYTASDNYDGDLTGRVQVSSDLDRFTPGQYTVTYTVSDSYQNTTSATRTVLVEEWEIAEGEMPRFGEPNGKVIYLTFDDGPGPDTPRLLDILKKYNVKATFFVVNTAYVDTVKRIAAEGHTVAMHANTHTYKEIYANEDAYFKDLYSIQGVIKALSGKESKILRFPGGGSNTVSRFNPGIMTRLTKLVGEKGFTYYDWNVDSNDAGGAKTPQEVFTNVTEGVLKDEKNFSVVLQHDTKSYSIDAVESIILWGLEQGYAFLPLEEYSPVCHHTVRN